MEKKIITKEQLLTSSHQSKITSVKGVLTKKEQEEQLSARKGIMTIGSYEDGVFFFTDDYCMGLNVLPKHYVSSSTTIPIQVAPREGLEDGIVDSVDKFIQIFESERRLIESMDDLLEVLNSNKFTGEKEILYDNHLE